MVWGYLICVWLPHRYGLRRLHVREDVVLLVGRDAFHCLVVNNVNFCLNIKPVKYL